MWLMFGNHFWCKIHQTKSILKYQKITIHNFLITGKTEKSVLIFPLKFLNLIFRMAPMAPRGSPRLLNARKRVTPKFHSKFFQEYENQVLKILWKKYSFLSYKEIMDPDFLIFLQAIFST